MLVRQSASRNSVDEGTGGLSVGEQQRLAMIRILSALS